MFRSNANDVLDVAFPMVVRNQVVDGGWTTAYGDGYGFQSTIETRYLAAQEH